MPAQTQQEQLKSMADHTRERSFLALPAFGHVEPTLFEGNLVTHQYFEIKKKNILVDFTFKVVLRMLQLRSCPIRTPGYQPSLTVHRILRTEEGEGSWFASLMLGHHSNGQDGAFYKEGGTEVNLVDGNFSTNYIKAGLTKNFSEDEHGPYMNVAFERHLDIDRNKELKGSYGFSRLHFNMQSQEIKLNKWFKKISENNTVRIKLNAMWIADKLRNVKREDASKRLVISTSLSYRPSVLKEVSFFCQAYYGQDYYNINYGNIISFVRLGVNIEPVSIIKLKDRF
jgi:hypothetical protein